MRLLLCLSSLLLVLSVRTAPAPAPAEPPSVQELCANFTLEPEYYPYLDTSFRGKGRSIQVGTVAYFYYQFGPLNVSSANAGRPLILLGGVGDTTHSWSPCLLRPLAAGRQVTLFDNRGIGMSNDTYTGNYTLVDYASSTVDLIEALELDTPDILGTSLGSLIVQTILVNYPSTVMHAILGDTALTGAGLLTIPDPVSASNVFVASQGAPGASSPTRTYPYYLPEGLEGLCRNQNLTANNPEDTATSAQLNQQATIENDIAGPGGDEVYYALQNITNPVFIIAGQQDMVLPVAYDIEAASIIPDCSLIQWPDAGHASMEQHCLSNAAFVTSWVDDKA